MRRLFNPDDWPVEDLSYAIATAARRGRRKFARRKGLYLGGLVGVAVCWLTVSNGLWGQSSEHPAPIFESAAQDAPRGSVEGLIAAHNAAEYSPLIQSVQERLRASGHFVGEADGVMSADTRGAIESFEREAGLPVTGRPTLALLTAQPEPQAEFEQHRVRSVATERIEPRSFGQQTPPLSGDPVDLALVQQALNDAGFGPLVVDGLDGPNTRTAISRFAEARGLPADDGTSPAFLDALGVRR
ncbi:MAG: peptidoglycan-binding protein [Pseudomonadota bacterium]